MCKKTKVISLAAFIVLALFSALPISAQDNTTYQEKRAKAFDLVKQNKFTEAQPAFEELVRKNPDDAAVQYYAGYMTFVNAQNIKDAELRKREGLKARDYLTRAQQLGIDNALLRNMFLGIAPDGTIDRIKYSNIVEADKALHAGEEAFAKGDFKKALEAYAKALEIEPNFYEAALYTGDVYYKSNEMAKAGEWFARAIAIDPNQETAYRYWGDTLAKEGKTGEAREKFIDAFVAEPYSNFGRAGLINWARANGVQLAHPAINIPTSVSSSGGNTNITVDPSMFDKNKKDGSSAWFYYSLARAAWTIPAANGRLSEKFLKAYPNETIYRHSLAEEVDALRSVLSFLDKDIKDKKVEKLEPSLENLKRINDAGLLEAYVLIAKPDNGIVRDYKSYRQNNRDKLRRYVVEYIINSGGK